MKSHFTLKDLIRLAGKKGDPMGSAEACIYFDGRIAAAANSHATLEIDCPQPLAEPILLSVKDLKIAQAAAPELALSMEDGRLRANGVRVPHLVADDVMPEQTQALLHLARDAWRLIAKPFRLDGTRWKQILPAMPDGDIRHYLNGAYLDLATGAIVGLNGRQMHLVEDALPPQPMPPEHLPGVIVPTAVIRALAAVGGVQEAFVLQKKPVPGAPAAPSGSTQLPERVICFAVANAKYRTYTIAAGEYPQYRAIFERNKGYPVSLLLDAHATRALRTVARVAKCNPNYQGVHIEGEGRGIKVAHLDLISQTIQLAVPLAQAFEVMVHAGSLLDALDAAASFGVAVSMRYSLEEGQGIYVGAQDFHAIVAPMRGPDEDDSESAMDAQQQGDKPLATAGT